MHDIPIFGKEASLPKICGGLMLAGVETFPDPGLGVKFRYQGFVSDRADVYLYDLGSPHILTDLESPDIVEQFQQAVTDVFSAAEVGCYEDLELVSSQYLHLPPDSPEPFCLWAALRFHQPPGPQVFYTGPQISHLTLRSDRGYFNKVRYSYPESETSADKRFRGFLIFLVEWTSQVQSFSSE